MSSFLPPDIITDILSRLPVKPLVRFRCVSKPWYSLIDSSDFVKMHLNQSLMSKSNRNLILGFKDFSVHSIEFRSLDSPGVDSIDSSVCLQPPVSGTYVSGSCNGLSHIMFMVKPDCIKHYIWNPFTRKYRELPVVSLDFQGLPSSVRMLEKHGFAYVSETDEYKVVQVTEFRGLDFSYICNQAYIFSSRTNEWERLEPFPYQIRSTRTLDAHLNGALHNIVETDSSKWELMVFDTKTKKHSMFPKPDFDSEIVHVRLQVLEENLCLVHLKVINSVDARMDIWIMKDYGVEASWFKLLSVAPHPGLDLTTTPLTMTCSENGAAVLMSDNVKKLKWYNLSGESESVREVTVNVLPSDFFAEVWYESLVSFPGFISVDEEKGNGRKGKKQDDVNMPIQQKRLKGKGNTSLTKGFLSHGFKLKL